MDQDPFDSQFHMKSADVARTSVGTSSNMRKATSTANIVDDLSSIFGGLISNLSVFLSILSYTFEFLLCLRVLNLMFPYFIILKLPHHLLSSKNLKVKVKKDVKLDMSGTYERESVRYMLASLFFFLFNSFWLIDSAT